MTLVISLGFVLLLGLLIATFIWAKRLEERLAEKEREIIGVRNHCEAEQNRVYAEAQSAVTQAQKLIDAQFAAMQQEAESLRTHYETEARRLHADTQAQLTAMHGEYESLQKFRGLQNAEAQTKLILDEALAQATKLKEDARALLLHSEKLSREERAALLQKATDKDTQADARLSQAIRDAGRIVAEAEKRAEKIGGDAYGALKNKELLENAAAAMRNIIEGYGDKYLIPTHSLLDDLAAEYGYDAAGQSLASAREQSRKMIEEGEAAACEYSDANRRATAIQFVIHAFNGAVDAILTRVKSDNFGTLEQKIRDSYSIVNSEGSAFRNARILPAYLDSRLSELKWAVVVHELAQRDREEQRFLREQERDRLKAEQEQQRKLQEAEKEKDLIRTAMEEAERRFASASAEQRAASEREVNEWRKKFEEATRKELTIAQVTRKGRIYIISNVGSFGEGVYKIGLTRRSVEERVDELGDASVPFEFDIHAVIETENAPALEFKIHQHFLPVRVNKVNMRKEFFRVTLQEIRQTLETLNEVKEVLGSVSWTEKARAQQYFESLDIDNNQETKEKWLKRARAVSERRERAVYSSQA